jgi:lipoprotein signal peptidase
VPDRSTPLARFALVAAAAAAADLATKALAARALADRVVPLGGPFSLDLAYNTGSAGGVSLGEQTWAINVLATAVALVLAAVICRPVAAHDRRAPVALGLIAGGALGNLTSLFLPPAGVADFLAVGVGGGGAIFNVADVAAYVGIALCARTGLRLVETLRIERRAPVVAAARMHAARHIERVVEIPVVADAPLPAAPRPADAPPARRRAPDDAPAREAPREERRAEI